MPASSQAKLADGRGAVSAGRWWPRATGRAVKQRQGASHKLGFLVWLDLTQCAGASGLA